MSTYVPSVSNIVDVSNAQYAVITLEEDHHFFLWQTVSLRCSRPYGMFEINNLQGQIIDMTSDTITLNVDTTTFTPFVYPPLGTVKQVAQVVPVGAGIEPIPFIPTMIVDACFDNVPE